MFLFEGHKLFLDLANRFDEEILVRRDLVVFLEEGRKSCIFPHLILTLGLKLVYVSPLPAAPI